MYHRLSAPHFKRQSLAQVKEVDDNQYESPVTLLDQGIPPVVATPYHRLSSPHIDAIHKFHRETAAAAALSPSSLSHAQGPVYQTLVPPRRASTYDEVERDFILNSLSSN